MQPSMIIVATVSLRAMFVLVKTKKQLFLLIHAIQLVGKIPVILTGINALTANPNAKFKPREKSAT